MGNVVEFEVFRDYLGVAPTDPAVDDVGKLYDAINAECRRLTGRQFEGDGGATYDEVIRIYGAREFTLPRAPVASIVSLTRVRFDGTEDDVLETTRYRLDDAMHGRIRIHCDAEYIHAVWTTTGEIPPQAIEAALEWGKDRWANRDSQAGGLLSYSTGQDSETYSAGAVAGAPPAGAIRLLLAVSLVVNGAVI